jgi:HSP20 family protein
MMLFDMFPELDRISSAFFSGVPESLLSSTPVDLYREGDRYVMEADLPGFDPSSIDVSAEAGLLTIRAQRDVSREDSDERWFVRERGSARVVRQVALGRDVDLDAIDADYRNGVLRVVLPVRADALPKKVAVALEGGEGSAREAIASGAGAKESAHPKARPAHSVAS